MTKPNNKQRIALRIAPDVYALLRATSAATGMTMIALVENAVRIYTRAFIEKLISDGVVALNALPSTLTAAEPQGENEQ